MGLTSIEIVIPDQSDIWRGVAGPEGGRKHRRPPVLAATKADVGGRAPWLSVSPPAAETASAFQVRWPTNPLAERYAATIAAKLRAMAGELV